jgi:hypothetical protein
MSTVPVIYEAVKRLMPGRARIESLPADEAVKRGTVDTQR